MSRDFKAYLDDILEAIARVRKYTSGLSQIEFAQDTKCQDAVIRNLEVIGEAVRMIPDNIRQGAPTIEWRKVSGLRDILIHKYFGVDLDIIWDIVAHKLDDLELEVQKLCERS